MSGQGLGERLPLVQEPRDLLFRLLALERDGAGALAVGVEGGIGQRPTEILEPRLHRVNFGFEGVEPPPALADGRIDAAALPGPAVGRRWRGGGSTPLRRAGL